MEVTTGLLISAVVCKSVKAAVDRGKEVVDAKFEKIHELVPKYAPELEKLPEKPAEQVITTGPI